MSESYIKQSNGASTAERHRIQTLERELGELRRVNEALRLVNVLLAEAKFTRAPVKKYLPTWLTNSLKKRLAYAVRFARK
ncbi:hypothetical protein N0A02_33865 (plasmid) [Paraburkholderia acidicola]|uniref:Transposase n=1 Tax=Paraburkholderia acidicola TaxID=1912599 RepID=A0ABV1LYP0_9BURK